MAASVARRHHCRAGAREFRSTGRCSARGWSTTSSGTRDLGRLMIEGGTSIHTAVLAAGLADELHLAVAPLLIGQADAPRFVNPAEFPGGARRRMQLAEVTQIGDVALLRYFPKVTSADS
ncbi:dihydrofolate reductase family protein [Nocardia nova]|uniref:dihydrofolate reductase family protein n=1 Tax=Nocardia nova TaxID=37330 RepID=UPI002481CECE|nr:dihydrofolate reductase family protein [Nocardia nova]